MPEIKLPPLGETVEEAVLLRWLKAPGDWVQRDESLYEVETDKVTTDVPSPADGYLIEIRVPEGATVPIGTVLGVLDPTANTVAAGSVPVASTPETAAISREEVIPVVGTSGTTTSATPARHLIPRSDPRIRSPLVRRLLQVHGLDPHQLRGTGRGGRVVRDDVLTLLAGDPGVAAAAMPPERVVVPENGAADEVERVRFSTIRRITAEHMVRSKATSAHTLTVVEVDYERVAAVRAAAGEQFKQAEGFSLTYLPFVLRAAVEGLREFPHLNAHVGADELLVHKSVHLGVAVALGFEGLVVPVIRGAEELRLRDVAKAVYDVSSRARTKQLRSSDLEGGTFTVTNPGGYGTFVGAAIIHQPQVAILNVDGVAKQAVVVERQGEPDSLAIHRIGHLSLSWDHRAIDGLYAAAFLDFVRAQIETRDWAREL